MKIWHIFNEFLYGSTKKKLTYLEKMKNSKDIYNTVHEFCAIYTIFSNGVKNDLFIFFVRNAEI